MAETFNTLVFAVLTIATSCLAEAPLRHHIRLTGPYPPTGLKPDLPFELPTEAAASFPEPAQAYGPPEQTYGVPEQSYGPPEQTHGPPDHTNSANVEQINTLAHTAAIFDSSDFLPQTYIALPRPERLTSFRPIRPSQLRQPNSLSLRRQTRPEGDYNALPQTASIIGPRDFLPQTYFTLPHPERLVAFRSNRPPAFGSPSSHSLRRPAAQPLRRPGIQAAGQPSIARRPAPPRPAKLTVTVGGLPSAPHTLWDHIIALSEQLQIS